MAGNSGKNLPAVFTVGHSTRPLETFLALLKTHGVEKVVDVRTIPRSRHNPQFNRETLAGTLRAARIGYRHLKGLGGLRRARRDSKNLGWHNASFRGFADYMQTPEFEQGLEQLLDLAAHKQVAILCAEAVPWRCHRSLIADALLVRGIRVEHILSGRRRNLHQLTPFARVRGKRITYPAETPGPAPHRKLPAAPAGKARAVRSRASLRTRPQLRKANEPNPALTR